MSGARLCLWSAACGRSSRKSQQGSDKTAASLAIHKLCKHVQVCIVPMLLFQRAFQCGAPLFQGYFEVRHVWFVNNVTQQQQHSSNHNS